jgi:drug/metabolite transporter (DMT)-like permease
MSEVRDLRTEHADYVMGRQDYILYAVTILTWGSSWYAMHLQLGVVAPEVSLFWRFSGAAILMLVIALVRGQPLRFPWRTHLRFAALGACLFSTNLLMYYNAGLTVNSGLLAVFFSLAAIVNPLMATVVLKQPLQPRLLLAALVGIFGVMLMFGPEALLDNKDGAGHGLLFAAMGTLLFSSGNMISGRIQYAGISVLSANAWGMVYGSTLLGLVAYVNGRPFIIEPTVYYLGSMVWTIVFSSVIAFFVYLTLLGRIGAARTSYTTVLFPVLALLISTVFENYHWTPLGGLGLLCVLGGNLMGMVRRAREHG